MKFLCRLCLLAALAVQPALADEPALNHEADLKVKAARIEILRVRSVTAPSPATTAGLGEADELLRQLREAPASERAALRERLDAVLARLDAAVASQVREAPKDWR